MLCDEWLNDYFKKKNCFHKRIQWLNESVINNIVNDLKYNPNQKMVLTIPNTKGVSFELLNRIPANLHDKINIRVEGFMNEKWAQWYLNYYNNSSSVYNWIDASVYSINELQKILVKFEKIEQGVRSEMSEDEKVVYLAEMLSEYIDYDQTILNGREYLHSEVASLRGFVSSYYDSKSVCAGMGIIFKELLDRQEIDCECVVGQGIVYNKNGVETNRGSHLWNLIKTEDKNGIKTKKPLDITWLISNRQRGIKDNTHYYTKQDNSFNRSHIVALGFPLEQTNKMGAFDEKAIQDTKEKYVNNFKEFRRTSQVLSPLTSSGGKTYLKVVRLDMEEIAIDTQTFSVYKYFITNGKQSQIVYSCKDVIGAYKDYALLNYIKENGQLKPQQQVTYSNLTNYLTDLNSNVFTGTNINRANSEETYFLDPNIKNGDASDLQQLKEYYAKKNFNIFGINVRKGNANHDHCFVVEKNNSRNSGTKYNQYTLYYTNVNEQVFQQTIFTEYDLQKLSVSANENDKKIINTLLNPETLNTSVRKNNGYLGSLSNKGPNSGNPQ